MKNKIKRKRLIIWGGGFLVLLLINLLVEAVLLPYFGLDNTDKNDIYFQSWWVLVGTWLLFGLLFLKYIEKKKNG